MSKYDKYNPRSRMPERQWKIHPVWRGIGCMLIILIPIIAYAGAILLVEANLLNHWIPLPRELMRDVTIPYIGKINDMYANLLVTVVLTFIGFGFLTAVYSFIYRVAGPPRYGPLDAPPPRRKPGKRRR